MFFQEQQIALRNNSAEDYVVMVSKDTSFELYKSSPKKLLGSVSDRSEIEKLSQLKLHQAINKTYITSQIRDSIKGAKRFRTLKKS